jgi:Protein of unknown function (DUF3365)
MNGMAISRVLASGCLTILAVSALSCGEPPPPAGVSPQVMADALYAVMAADRTVYTREVVNRLQNEEKLIKAVEHWKDEKGLPLPAQMFRMGAEAAQKSNSSFTYSLLSQWPINKQNGPKTEVEKEGLKAVAETGKNFYKEEKLGEKKYFTAVYADKATVEACPSCHNDHKDSPRKDFKVGDVLGGVVIRIPLDK